jgi:hypothetical protein
MIDVVFSPQCREIRQSLKIEPEDVWTTINDRHQGLITDGADRVIAVHWFSDDSFVLVDSFITKKKVHKESNRVQLKQVTAQIALILPPNLPSGAVRRGMPMEEILKVVAESFGHPVTCHPDAPALALYTGQWDGKKIDVKLRNPGLRIYSSGTFYPKTKTCELVWALDIDRYRRWLTLN